MQYKFALWSVNAQLHKAKREGQGSWTRLLEAGNCSKWRRKYSDHFISNHASDLVLRISKFCATTFPNYKLGCEIVNENRFTRAGKTGL